MERFLDPNDPASRYQDDPDEVTIPELCGWIPAPAEVERILQQNPQPLFSSAAPHLEDKWDGKNDIRLWDACIKVTGSNLPAHKQSIGDCVSHGWGTALDYVQCVQIANGINNQFVINQHEVYTEAIYGMMRERANKLNFSDGAIGIWGAESLLKDGAPVRQGRLYDGKNAKLWGAKGTPLEIKQAGSEQRIAQYLQVRTVKESCDLLSAGNPIVICSGQGFTMKRDENGICEAQGSWSHCMLCIGLIMVSGELIFIILQSWGQMIPTGPVIKNMPNNSFGCRENIFQRILDARDSYCPTALPGFPAQSVNFTV